MNLNNRGSKSIESSPQVYARIAGVIGLITLVAWSFSGFVTSQVMIPGDAFSTASNLLNSEPLFRFGIVAGLFMQIVCIFYVVILYKILRPVNKSHARLMIIFLLLSVPIFMLNQLNQIAAIELAADQMNAQMMLFLDLHRHGEDITGIFWGLWLFPLGYLVFKSGFIPRLLGILLMIGCFGYLIRFLQAFLFPGSEAAVWTNPALVVTHISELCLMFWLLIKGVDVEKWQAEVRKGN